MKGAKPIDKSCFSWDFTPTDNVESAETLIKINEIAANFDVVFYVAESGELDVDGHLDDLMLFLDFIDSFSETDGGI